jgi:hypothetical protein
MLSEDLDRFDDETVIGFFNTHFPVADVSQSTVGKRKISDDTLMRVIARAASVDAFLSRMSEIRPEALPEPVKPVPAKPSRQAAVKAIANSLRS